MSESYFGYRIDFKIILPSRNQYIGFLTSYGSGVLLARQNSINQYLSIFDRMNQEGYSESTKKEPRTFSLSIQLITYRKAPPEEALKMQPNSSFDFSGDKPSELPELELYKCIDYEATEKEKSEIDASVSSLGEFWNWELKENLDNITVYKSSQRLGRILRLANAEYKKIVNLTETKKINTEIYKNYKKDELAVIVPTWFHRDLVKYLPET